MPAALAFRALCCNDAYTQPGNYFSAVRILVEHTRVQITLKMSRNSYLGYDEQRRNPARIFLQQPGEARFCLRSEQLEDHFGFETGINPFRVAGSFESFQCLAANFGKQF